MFFLALQAMQILNPSLETIVEGFKSLQDQICAGLEALDGRAKFQEDPWSRPEGGGGRTRLIQQGDLIEKGGVNFSHVYGPLPKRIADALKQEAGLRFDATGVSIVLHGRNPFVPIIHMNVRYFELENGVHWFGGGIDTTPIYIDQKAAIGFHQSLKDCCDQFDPLFYPNFKLWADEYFYLKHRKETRGIGGIFFDHLKAETEAQKTKNQAFALAVGGLFVPAYAALVKDNRDRVYTERELDWQALRRSRYVEFNLLWDKGTRFGLDTDGRTESILMSMPPMARWEYNHQPLQGSPEAATLAALKPIDWLGIA